MPHTLLIGLLAALAAALIGSGWQLASRHGVTTTLGPLELAVMRYGIPALVLLPLLFKGDAPWRSISLRTKAMLVLGAGLPFGLLALAGARYAPATHGHHHVRQHAAVHCARWLGSARRREPRALCSGHRCLRACVCS